LQVNRIFISGFIIKVKGILIMLDSPQEKAEKDKVIKKLMSKWLKVQETARKANLLLSKNPELKIAGTGKSRKVS
jgi:type II restriction/modification system DNA methylase subunit YeeA